MKIKGKRLAALGVLVFLCLALAGCGYFAIIRVAEIVEVETAFNKISTTTLQMRATQNEFLTKDTKNEKFMESGKSQYVSDMRKLAAVRDSIISSLLENKWSAKLDIHQDLKRLKTNFEVYNNTFRKLTEAYKKRGLNDFGDEGELRVAVRAVEESDYKIDMVQLLILRRIENDFFIRKDMEDVEKFTAEITAFLDKIDNGGKGQELKIKIATYEAKFNALVKDEETIGLNEKLGLLGEVGNIIYKTEPIIEKLEKLSNARSREMVFQTILIFTLVSLIELIVGFILAIKFSKNLAANIQNVRKAAFKLSQRIIPEQLEIKTQR